MAEDLSPEGQQLLTLCGVEGDEDKMPVAQALKEHPELLSALDEYIKYREEYSKSVEHRTMTPRVQHGLSKKIKKDK